MTTPFARGMSRATELTRAGKLGEATALLQSLLQGSNPPVAAPSETMNDIPHSAGMIEGTSTRLGHTPAGPTPPAGRKSLRESLRDLAERGLQGGNEQSPQPLEMPEGAQFLSLSHRGAKGSRDYRLYRPAHQREELMPLVVMLHGCTQSADDFAVGTGMNALAEEFGCLIAWPIQAQGANAQKCWNWFRPEDQMRDHGEPSLIAGLVRDILRDQSADASRVYVAGLSAGGAAAAIMGAAYPDLFAAVGVHSGLPVGCARDLSSALAAMRSGSKGKAQVGSVPTIVFHGLADATVHPGNGAAVIAQVLQTLPDLELTQISGVSDGGRIYRQTRHESGDGRSIAEHWEIEGAGHAWAGGRSAGSYTDPKGPDASREMLRFFLQHRQV